MKKKIPLFFTINLEIIKEFTFIYSFNKKTASYLMDQFHDIYYAFSLFQINKNIYIL
jgi:hypothetical protein